MAWPVVLYADVQRDRISLHVDGGFLGRDDWEAVRGRGGGG